VKAESLSIGLHSEPRFASWQGHEDEIMFKSQYRFTMTISDEDGKVIQSAEAGDFLPCYEDLLFSAICSGSVANNGQLPAATIEPVWMEGETGRVAGVVASVLSLSKVYTLSVFSDRVWEILLTKNLTSDGEESKKRFSWQVDAHPREEEKRRRFASSVTRQPYPIQSAALGDFGIAHSVAQQQPMSIYIAAALLEELKAESAAHLDMERADILCGHLIHEDQGAALVVTGRVAAKVETAASKAHFAFSPLTFMAAEQEIARRGDGAIICGWHHNHPPPCGRECLQTVPACKSQSIFFSSDDRLVHRASFPVPYMIALVSGKGSEVRADCPEVKAYGWHDAVIQEREVSIF
jgi:hypothetical protein